jgi:hypothetical protein
MAIRHTLVLLATMQVIIERRAADPDDLLARVGRQALLIG